MTHDDTSDRRIQAFEQEAEVLLAYELDLLAHLESQLRATDQMIRRIHTLRTAENRVGPELSNGQRGNTVAHLSTELDRLVDQLKIQWHLCAGMHTTIDAMEQRLRLFRVTTVERRPEADAHDA
jgi:hypothetical protein